MQSASFAVSSAWGRWLCGASLALCAVAAQADYVWIERSDANSAVVHAGQLDGERRAAGPVEQADLRSGGEQAAIELDGDRLVVSGLEEGKDVRVRTWAEQGEGVLMYYQARHGRNETAAELDFELVPTEPGGNTFRLMWMGTPVKATYVRVSTSEGWTRLLTPAEDGSVTLTTPFPGLYVLQLTAKASGWAEVGGKRYKDVRHTATLSFTVEP